MSEFLFGTRRGKLTAAEKLQRLQLAAKHGIEWIYAEMPDGPQSWFAAENLGEPFDGNLQRAVLSQLDREEG